VAADRRDEMGWEKSVRIFDLLDFLGLWASGWARAAGRKKWLFYGGFEGKRVLLRKWLKSRVMGFYCTNSGVLEGACECGNGA
jgi:hypothetical protein